MKCGISCSFRLGSLLRHLASSDGCPLGLLSLPEVEGAGGKAAPEANRAGAGCQWLHPGVKAAVLNLFRVGR